MYASGMCNSDNPFAYNYRSWDVYFAMYLKVFRRQTVMMPQHLYNLMLHKGLFDENHTIGTSPLNLWHFVRLTISLTPLPGEPYTLTDKSFLCTREHKLVKVYYHDKPLDSFSVILAKPPQH